MPLRSNPTFPVIQLKDMNLGDMVFTDDMKYPVIDTKPDIKITGSKFSMAGTSLHFAIVMNKNIESGSLTLCGISTFCLAKHETTYEPVALVSLPRKPRWPHVHTEYTVTSTMWKVVRPGATADVHEKIKEAMKIYPTLVKEVILQDAEEKEAIAVATNKHISKGKEEGMSKHKCQEDEDKSKSKGKGKEEGTSKHKHKHQEEDESKHKGKGKEGMRKCKRQEDKEESKGEGKGKGNSIFLFKWVWCQYVYTAWILHYQVVQQLNTLFPAISLVTLHLCKTENERIFWLSWMSIINQFDGKSQPAHHIH
ncbi:hypothetical protein PILCRDRAFT_84638 [Piloderma croceum F 1598]|uniref:Uncharacterized protein n=1 Tax=Piloderma croceum (strain F 1598) TaxID=765440 RepID=A0A0C3BT68_PILCF|nr:hypothetical protein PILCRDRAFT_84638 [Piloderma croceum F 1598]